MAKQPTDNRYQNQAYLVQDQYKNAEHLDARIQLHRRFSVNPADWSHWLLDHFRLQPGTAVLECGCGPGNLWAKSLERLPTDLSLTLTDLSPGMVETARANLDGRLPHVRFQVADIQELPFEDASFDVVVANHMLYHVPDLAQGLSEVQRVLRPGGRFFAATNGGRHMQELFAIGNDLFPRLREVKQERLELQPHSFRLENGREFLAPYFTDITLHRYDDWLEVTEAKPLLDYALSSSEVRAAVTDEMYQRATTYLEALIAEQGMIKITKESGLFKARRPFDSV
jgi:SAM-dependent methyltransferase